MDRKQVVRAALRKIEHGQPLLRMNQHSIRLYTSFKSLHTTLRSLYGTNFVELRTMCTMQCWICVSGKTALTASGNENLFLIKPQYF